MRQHHSTSPGWHHLFWLALLTRCEAKSAVARPEERKFLGFSISNDGSERRIAPKALDKFKVQIWDMTRRTRGISLQQLIEDLTPYLTGWRGSFGRRFPAVGALVQPVGSAAPSIDNAGLGENTKRTDTANDGGLATSVKGDAQRQ